MEKHILTVMAQLGSPSELGIPERTADYAALLSILDLVYAVAAVVTVVCIVVYGIMYSLSSGDPGKITRAKNGLLYAIIGLLVVAFAFTITNYVSGRF